MIHYEFFYSRFAYNFVFSLDPRLLLLYAVDIIIFLINSLFWLKYTEKLNQIFELQAVYCRLKMMYQFLIRCSWAELNNLLHLDSH